MAKETKTPNGPKVLGEIDFSDFIAQNSSKRKSIRKRNRPSVEKNYSSYIEEIEQRENISKERKSTIRFFCEIVLPLYKILFNSKTKDNICDYIDNSAENRTKKRAAILDISSEEVFETLTKYHQSKYVEELLYHFYPNIIEFKTLKECLESNDKSLFCQKLEEYNKVEIYELCLYYLQIEREFHFFDVLFSIQSQIELDDYLERGVVSKDFIPRQCRSSSNSFISISLLKTGTKWIEDKLYGLDIEDLKDYTIGILSCIDKLTLTTEHKKQLDQLKQNSTIGFLQRCTTSPELRYISDENDIDAVNSGPKDILFRTEIDDTTRKELVELIVKYLGEPTQTRAATKKKSGFTVETTAQKSVIDLLKKTGCLHEDIKPTNHTNLHKVITRFIEEYVGLDNVGSSARFNKAKLFREYDPKKLIIDSSNYKKYYRFKDFELKLQEIIKK